ncbi:pilus assembly protein [Pseudomonas quasicaspiana]|uniref:pilus assembly protein n=1 Tax=Pseudomonas quasicaspiana TaxID=2829821 RepID=UPI001E4AE276|nr:PilC/PilY family type IV pilus protein [Pseudomonas quasicaspiana]MCD5972298.1 pilus assembly protein [Pseudomonas quasicaspiana]
MPFVKSPGRLLKYLYGAVLALYLTAPAYAFTPAQVPLLSSPAVPPNLMLLVDNSGSMYNIIWSSSFDPLVKRTDVSYFSTQCLNAAGAIVICPFETTISGDQTLTLGDINSSGVLLGISLNCLLGGVPVRRSGTTYCLDLPDPAGNGRTRYTANYLSWLIDSVRPVRVSLIGIGLVTIYYKDYTDGSIPNDYRMNVAKTVATNLVTNNTSLRIGLAQFNEPIDGGDRGPGGRISREITDLSPVTATTYQPNGVNQGQANINITNLKNAISALVPTANTPLAETYYEITRYFRGMTSYYPRQQTTYTSPIQYRCQKNYGVVITDGLPTYDRTFPGDDPDDVADTSRSLPNWDNVANDGTDPITSNSAGGDDEGDTLYLDDLARFAYDIDMRKAGNDLTGKSWDTTGFNKQNMSTYTIGFTTSSDQMLIDAADDSHGRGKYYQTGDSAGLTAALNQALGDIYAKAGSGGGGATNSATLSSGTRFYQTMYDPKDWHGTLKAFNLNATTGALSTALWSTDNLITSSSPGPLFESWNTVSGARMVLDYNNLTGAQKTAFDATLTNLPAGVTGAQVVNWSKGTANARLRTRTILLGDIINSPLIPALPTDKTSADMAGNTTYSTYLTRKASSMNYNLLVNANDGFFNVINPDNGARRYAYMPSTSLASLATIASTTYGSGTHKFTVDGQIAVFDTQAGTSWRTIAFGGTGAGGKAFFAIKLFESDNSIQALWEVKAPDTSTPANLFNNLGYAYSKPDVARMADGTSIVVMGNGYGSFTGDASLFVLNANTGALIREIPIPASAKLADNGLSSVKLRVNAQNVVQAAYAGDLKGRLWKFDMSSSSAANWSVAFSGKPLFTATAPDNTPQPITAQPLLLDHPLNGKMVYFGTGKFSEITDKTTNSQQAFYAIWDGDAATGGYVQNNLQPQNITGTITGNGATYFTTSNNDVDWTLRKGWYMTLSTTDPYVGERIIYPAQTSRGRIIFTTAAVNSSDPCESTGIGRLFELDAAKGGMLNYQVLDTNGDGRIDSADTIVAGIGIGTGIPNLAAIVSGTSGRDDTKYLIDSSGGQATSLQEKGGPANIYQRIMWRQIQ